MNDEESLQELYNISGSIVKIYGPEGGECEDEIGQWFHGVFDAMHIFVWESYFSGDPTRCEQLVGKWTMETLREDAEMRHTSAYAEGYMECAQAIRKRWDSVADVAAALDNAQEEQFRQ